MSTVKIVIPVLNADIENYKHAVERAGALPIVLHSAEGLDINEYDGLLLPGGGDINPVRYGQENVACGVLDDALDELQYAFLDAAVKAGKPIFGICRGMQLMNIYFGGSLIQHIGTYKDHARDFLTAPDKVHDSVVSGSDSYLLLIYGEKFRINSSHHQALDRLGEGIVVDQYSTNEDQDGQPDRIIEAAHHSSLPIWMVQWHPERCRPSAQEPDEVDGGEVLKFFIDKVKQG